MAELEAQCHQEQEEYLRLINKYLDTRQPIAHKIKDDSSFSFIRGQEDAPSTSFSLKKLQPVQALRDILCQNNPTAKCFITTLPKEKKDALSFGVIALYAR